MHSRELSRKTRAMRPEQGESFVAFATRMNHLLDRWLTLSETEKSYEALRDLVLQEQLLQSVSKDLAIFLRERDLKSIVDMIKFAENYRLAHTGQNCARKAGQASHGLWQCSIQIHHIYH